VAVFSVGQALSLPTWQTMNVQPIAADIYANDCSLCYRIHVLFLLLRSPDRLLSTVRDDEEETVLAR
jgi:hypothetical protein